MVAHSRIENLESFDIIQNEFCFHGGSAAPEHETEEHKEEHCDCTDAACLKFKNEILPLIKSDEFNFANYTLDGKLRIISIIPIKLQLNGDSKVNPEK